MELLVKLAALSLCVSAVTALLKKSDEALSLLLLLAAVLVGCAMLLPALSDLFDFCERALSLTDLPLTLFVPVVKVTAIARRTSSAASAPIAPSNSKDSLPTGNFTRLEALMLVGASHMATDEKLRRKVAERLS